VLPASQMPLILCAFVCPCMFPASQLPELEASVQAKRKEKVELDEELAAQVRMRGGITGGACCSRG